MSDSWEEARSDVFTRLIALERGSATMSAELHAARAEQARYHDEMKEDMGSLDKKLDKLFTVLEGEPGRMGLKDRLFRVEIVVVPAVLAGLMVIAGIAGAALKEWVGI